MPEIDLEDARQIVEQLESDREPWIPLFKDIQEVLLPDRGLFPSAGDRPNSGEKHGASIYDATGTRTLRVLAAGMQGGLTSPAREWFRLGLEDRDLENYHPVKLWLSRVERIMYQALARSNFYQEAHSVYIEQAGFGTSCLLVDDHPTQLVRFRTLTIGTYAIGADDMGVINTLCRRLFMSPQQLAMRFGIENLSRAARDLLDRQSREKIEVIHLVAPRKGWDDRKFDKANMPFESVYWEAKTDVYEGIPLCHGGYREFPFLVPRWRVVGDEVWGRSPGMEALSDIEMLQEMDKSSLMAIHKSVDPPTIGPAEIMDDLDTSPGAHNVYESQQKLDGFSPLYEVRLALAEAEAKIARRQESIARTFYNDLFLMLADTPKGMTATEVLERQGEKLLMLGPVLERQQNDFHDPLIDRVFPILYRRGRIPLPPQEIAGMDMKVDYISLLAMAQKRERLKAINETARFVAALSAFAPEARDKFDSDRAVDQVAEITGIPPAIIRSGDQVAVLRRKRAMKQDARQKAEDFSRALKDGTSAAKALSQTDVDSLNRLTQRSKLFKTGRDGVV